MLEAAFYGRPVSSVCIESEHLDVGKIARDGLGRVRRAVADDDDLDLIKITLGGDLFADLEAPTNRPADRRLFVESGNDNGKGASNGNGL